MYWTGLGMKMRVLKNYRRTKCTFLVCPRNSFPYSCCPRLSRSICWQPTEVYSVVCSRVKWGRVQARFPSSVHQFVAAVQNWYRSWKEVLTDPTMPAWAGTFQILEDSDFDWTIYRSPQSGMRIHLSTCMSFRMITQKRLKLGSPDLVHMVILRYHGVVIK